MMNKIKPLLFSETACFIICQYMIKARENLRLILFKRLLRNLQRYFTSALDTFWRVGNNNTRGYKIKYLKQSFKIFQKLHTVPFPCMLISCILTAECENSVKAELFFTKTGVTVCLSDLSYKRERLSANIKTGGDKN